MLVTRGDFASSGTARGARKASSRRGFFSLPRDEEQGPAVLFADWTEAILLADMSGDGLMDIVRVRMSEVCTGRTSAAVASGARS